MEEDAKLIRDFVERFQRIPMPEVQAGNIAGLVRGTIEVALAGGHAMPFEAEASGFLLALEAEEEAAGDDR